MAQPLIEWQTYEHPYAPKAPDWYWAVGIVTITVAALAFIFGSVSFGIVIIVCVVALVIHASTEPAIIHCEINDRGIVVGDTLYPFLSLASFWVHPDNDPQAKIVLTSRKTLMTHVYIPIDEVDPESVRDILLTYITEREYIEPFGHKLLESFGF